MTRRIIKQVLGLAAGMLALAAVPAAHAHVNWVVGVNLPVVSVGVAPPQRVVYAPTAPVSRYVLPAPAYVPQAVMTYPPAVLPPVVYQPPVYPPVVYAPPPVYRPWGHGAWHHHHEHGGHYR